MKHQYQLPCWQDGMLLMPHHFQQWDRYQEQRHVEKILMNKDSWGVREMHIDDSLLMKGQLLITSLQVIFPNGYYFNSSTRDQLPSLFTLPDSGEKIVYIGINQDEKQSTFYQEIEITDPLTSINHQLTVCGKKLEVVLNPAQYQGISIPLLKLHSRNQQYKVDSSYYPPMLHANCSDHLVGELNSIQILLKHKLDLVQKIKFENANTISLLHCYYAKLYCLLSDVTLHPKNFFQVMLEMSLALADPEQHKVISKITYQHDNLCECISDVITLVTDILDKHIHEPWKALELKPEGTSQLRLAHASLAECQAGKLILTVPKTYCKGSLEKMLKLAPANQLDELVQYLLPGLSLHSYEPNNFAFNEKFACYLLDKQNKQWQFIIDGDDLLIHSRHSGLLESIRVYYESH